MRGRAEIAVRTVDRAGNYERRSDDPRFEQIIGCSPALEAVLDQVERGEVLNSWDCRAAR